MKREMVKREEKSWKVEEKGNKKGMETGKGKGKGKGKKDGAEGREFFKNFYTDRRGFESNFF